MSEEEYIRNRLDMINRNSHYGLMIDTEITKIVRDHIKRLEENKMEPTSVWKIENIDKIWITQDGDEISLLLKNRDDLTKITLIGDAIKNHNDQFITTLKVDMEENAKIMCEKDQDIRGLKEKIKQLERDNEFDKETADYWSDEYSTLSEKFAKLQEVKHQKIREKDKEIDKLKQQLQQVEEDKERLTERYKALENQYNLEEAANEAQHKFIREYSGKCTEVQFNYAIDDAKEVSYLIVDKERYNKLYEKWVKMQSEQDGHKYTRADILDQAKKCVCGQREQDYGTPESNFQLIADLWNDYLGITDYVLELEERFMNLNNKGIKVDVNFPKPKTIFPEDVAMMMALLKIARIRNGGGSGDSFVDLAGYAACGGEIWHGGKTQISKG